MQQAYSPPQAQQHATTTPTTSPMMAFVVSFCSEARAAATAPAVGAAVGPVGVGGGSSVGLQRRGAGPGERRAASRKEGGERRRCERGKEDR